MYLIDDTFEFIFQPINLIIIKNETMKLEIQEILINKDLKE